MSSPPPDLSTKSKHKKQSKVKEKSKDKNADKGKAVQVRNEGVNPNWVYAPPAGMVALNTSHIDEVYDWEALKNDADKELWIVRVPDGFKVKQLEGLQISQPCDAPGARLTTLERKRAKYDVWAVDPSRTEDTTSTPRGEELTGISCLLPRKKKGGRLYIAPKPIIQHIIVTHAPAAPQVDEESVPEPTRRQRVPKHLLKHRFIPYGASDTRIRDAMDLDIEDETMQRHEEKSALVTQDPKTPQKDTMMSVVTSTGKKAKKRRNTGESESPKRSKKPRV